jgi:hypothetical protein
MMRHHLSKREKARVRKVFANRCAACGIEQSNSPYPLEYDHHYPKDMGYPLTPGNAVLLCKSCNASKQERLPREWNQYVHWDIEEIQATLTRESGLAGEEVPPFRVDDPNSYYLDRAEVEAEREAFSRQVDSPKEDDIDIIYYLLDLLEESYGEQFGRLSDRVERMERPRRWLDAALAACCLIALAWLAFVT